MLAILGSLSVLADRGSGSGSPSWAPASFDCGVSDYPFRKESQLPPLTPKNTCRFDGRRGSTAKRPCHTEGASEVSSTRCSSARSAATLLQLNLIGGFPLLSQPQQALCCTVIPLQLQVAMARRCGHFHWWQRRSGLQLGYQRPRSCFAAEFTTSK